MSNSNKSDDPLPSEAIKHYVASGYEAKRLENDVGKLEFARTKQILKDVLPRPPAVIFDVGGGPGIYACWLAQEGYEVHLIDAVPLHVEMAENALHNLLGPASRHRSLDQSTYPQYALCLPVPYRLRQRRTHSMSLD